MRLSKLQIQIIKKEAISVFGRSTKVILFGSKVNNNNRGGDIDLMIETDQLGNNLWRKALTLNAHLQQKLGEQKIDIVTKYKGQKLQNIHKEVLKTGVVL